jgi:hypothetical protein
MYSAQGQNQLQSRRFLANLLCWMTFLPASRMMAQSTQQPPPRPSPSPRKLPPTFRPDDPYEVSAVTSTTIPIIILREKRGRVDGSGSMAKVFIVAENGSHSISQVLRVMSLFVLLMLVLAPGGELLRTPPLQTYTAEAAVPHDNSKRFNF